MVKQFKLIAFLEGISLLLLLFVAMPLKYIWNIPEAVSVVGMAHGILFLAYVAFALLIFSEMRWSLKVLSIVLLASLIPFGTFYMEKKYLTS
ncbi:MAG TPA: DUF3817 domain-containing protein [Flavobacteriaceae bacterium]|nr:DUF3817 domain-containing protein [Flavobacteriaceae bacterium]